MKNIILSLKKNIPFYSSYVSAMSRISALEMAFQISLTDSVYNPEKKAEFNGQSHRRAIFGELYDKFCFKNIFETGTFIGNTTGYLAFNTNAKIFTCEANKIFLALAQNRLKNFQEIEYYEGDSRSFLRETLAEPMLAEFKMQTVFFYLDAHWHDDLPLISELEIIATRLTNYIVMIDDFEVPEDGGYSYDNYGAGKSLDYDTFYSIFKRLKMDPYMPSITSDGESGGKRGCVVLSGKGVDKNLCYFSSLRQVRY